MTGASDIWAERVFALVRGLPFFRISRGGRLDEIRFFRSKRQVRKELKSSSSLHRGKKGTTTLLWFSLRDGWGRGSIRSRGSQHHRRMKIKIHDEREYSKRGNPKKAGVPVQKIRASEELPKKVRKKQSGVSKTMEPT